MEAQFPWIFLFSFPHIPGFHYLQPDLTKQKRKQ